MPKLDIKPYADFIDLAEVLIQQLRSGTATIEVVEKHFETQQHLIGLMERKHKDLHRVHNELIDSMEQLIKDLQGFISMRGFQLDFISYQNAGSRVIPTISRIK